MSSSVARKKAARISKSSHDKLTLERIIGTTSLHNSNLSINAVTGEIAYAAGCVVVIHNPAKHMQSRFLLQTKKSKAITCIAFSPNGKYLAAGESGYQPGVIIWDISSQSIVGELKGHKFGVSCVKFSPNGRLLASVGFEHDQTLNVWDWQKQVVVSKATVGSKIYSIAFNDEGTTFITAGNKHIKFWTIDDSKIAAVSNSSTPGGTRAETLDGRSAICRSYRESTFMDAAFGRGVAAGTLYAVTQQGFLVTFNATTRVLENAVDVKAQNIRTISITSKYVVCGCANGVVRLFDPISLDHVASMPKPNPLGIDVKTIEQRLAPSETAEPKAWADTICCQVIPDSTKMVCIYSNRSLFIWDFTDINKVGKYRSFLSHSACIWGVDTAKSVPGIPDSSFVTYAADGSIRFWNVSGEKIEASKANIYSKELVKCIQTSVEESKVDVSSTESIFLGDGGIRCAQVSPNGRLIASGDRTGSLRIYDLETNKLISCEEAHDAEILAVNFIQLNNDRTFLATGSRDRLIHIFESKGSTSNSFVLKNTLDDHTASITSLRFSRPNSSNAIIIASSAADKSILIRKMQDSNGSISRGQRTVTQGAIYDMSTDSSALSMIAVGQEKKLNFIDLSTAKISRSLKLDAEAGDQLSVHLDPSSTFAAISSQDKFIRVINTNNGEQIAKVSGHSEIVTGVKFLENGKRLVSVSGDGCIFIWKVSKDVVDMIEGKVAVQAKTKAAGSTTSSSSKTKTATASLRAIMNGEPIKVDHTKRKGKTSSAAPSAPRIKVTELNSVFNSAELPLWARRAIAAKPSPDELFLVSSDALDHSSSSGDLAPNRPLVRGAWANRLSAANNVVKIRTNDPKQPLIEYKLDDARESRRLSADFSSASAKQTIVDELNTTMSGDEDIIIFEQDDEKITSSKSSAASATPTRADETDTDDDFVDPAKLESMWSEFKEEPLDRMMKTNFDTLTDDFKPNPNRLSLSAKHRLVHTEPSTPAPEDVPAATSSSVPSTISNSSSTAASPSPSSPTSMTPTEPLSPQILAQSDSGVATPPPQPAASVSATSALTSDPTKPRDRKEVIAEEIERTRQRLMRLGMIGGKKEPEPARSSVNLSTASDVQPSNASMATESGLTSQSPPPTATAPSQQAYLVDEATDKVIHEIYTQDEIQAAAAAAAAVAVPPATQPAAEQDEGHTDSTGEDYELPVDEDLQDDEEYIGEDGEYDMELSEHAPTNDFLTGLSQAFDRTVDLYYELKRANRQDNIVDNIASFFSHVKSKLDKIVAEENERTVSAQTELLEKYSDALIAMVKAKLDK